MPPPPAPQPTTPNRPTWTPPQPTLATPPPNRPSLNPPLQCPPATPLGAFGPLLLGGGSRV